MQPFLTGLRLGAALAGLWATLRASRPAAGPVTVYVVPEPLPRLIALAHAMCAQVAAHVDDCPAAVVAAAQDYGSLANEHAQ